MVSDVNISSALQQQANTASAENQLAEDFSQFLNLLTVQLQNQDPLSPMDTTEFTNQLVAFTGVEQQINTNQKLDSLVALGLGQSFSAAQSYVGQEVSYVSSEFDFSGGSSLLRYSITAEASLSKINILNEAGQIVYSTDGSKNVGAHDFVWNGETNTGATAVPGTYTVRVEALDANENPLDVSTVVTGLVRGTESQNGEILLLIGERAVPVGSVLNTNAAGSLIGNNDALTSALQYVGLEITYLNSQIDYDGSTSENIIYDLESDADRAKLIVTDEDGRTIYTGDVDTDGGQNITTWDGTFTDGSPAPAGTYYFTIDAIDSNDQRVPYTSQAAGIVDGVETNNGQTFLTVGDVSVSLSNVVSANVVEPVSNGGSA